ncbi:hypothetical protein QA601_08020 [Chitinispirillales bacterium ANBcel5]|uniref:hypothetical protein n=1 Tax=Cellulosispirillum alkaliphilum TaxID=3039283 RepID=UPI002A4F6B83|nr:hypothetical protein [Chitinispirillales bacterium ANBcel5]
MLQIESLSFSFLTKALLIFVSTVSLAYSQFDETSEITSNNILSLSGSGDTLWIATDRGFNLIEGLKGDDWKGFRNNSPGEQIIGMDFRDGVFAALLLNSHATHPAKIWHYEHEGQNQHQISIEWPDAVRSEMETTPTGIVAYGNYFWIASQDGGLVRFDPLYREFKVFLPGSEDSDDLSGFIPPAQNTEEYSVQSVSLMDTVLVVTTPSRVFLFNPSDNSWSEEVSTSVSGNGYENFQAAFALQHEEKKVLYGFIGSDEQTPASLFRYSFETENWTRVFSQSPQLVSSAGYNGYFYTVYEENQINLHQDTLSVSSDYSSALSPVIIEDYHDYQARMSRIVQGEYPQRVNDILYLPRSDSSGTLVVATSAGLYISDNEQLSADGSEFRIVQHMRKIRADETYALPGIIRESADRRYDRAVFVYRLSRDARVSIDIYDYNMSHVKNIVSNSMRTAQSATGRSTEPSSDYWDGTDTHGRVVTPGVYYYKISSSEGERFFGKVIVAK